MKRFLSVLIVICMVIGVCPAIALAESTTLTAVRTAYFNSANEWGLYDASTGSDNILVSTGTSGWEAASSFTDTDGTVTSQPNLSGTGFLTSRNGVVSFTIPDDFNPDMEGKITLSLTVKNVKQVSSGARLAVYGNSINGTWSASSSKTTFGASGANSGLTNLTCLGLTSAISIGDSSGEIASGEVITLSSFALTDYVKQMAKEGKSEVTFRLAAPLGGIRIYSYNTSYAPTLTIEEGKITSAKVKTLYYNGEEVVNEEETTVGNLVTGSTYTYTDTPVATVVDGNDIFVYSKAKSTLSVTVAEDGTSEIVIVYEKYTGANSYNGYEIDDEGAWCWFADPRSISYKNEDGTIDITIIGYIDVHGDIKATQINNLNDKVDEVLIRTNLQPDDHNNPTFLVLPDERIVVFYSRHTDEACFWYRVTREPGDLTTLGEEKCLVTSANTTYPSPFLLSDDPDNIYLCWRGINWHPTIAKLSIPDENGDMHFTYGPFQMVQSTGSRPYAKYASNGKDKIYMSYTTGHPDNEDPNWLYFNQIDISTMTMQDINGNTMSTIANGPLNVNKSNTNQTNIVDRTSGVRNWLWQVAVAEDGYPVIANVRINGGKTSHDYYYVKWNGTEWVKTFMTNAGGKFHPSGTEYCYSGGMSIDTDNPNVIYCSKPVSGVFGTIWEIFKYTMSTDGTAVLSAEQITQNSLKNNVRPWVIPGAEDDELRLLWMSGDYDYWMVNINYPAGYPTAAMANVPLPTEKVDLDDAYLVQDYEDIGGVFVSTKDTASLLEEGGFMGPNLEFAISVDTYLDGDYTGTIFDSETVSLSVKNMTTRYSDNEEASRPRLVLTVDGVDYVSPNVYGTSDDWKYYSTGTTGDYYFTKYDKYINLTVVSDGEYITVYRNGLVDIKEKLSTDAFENVTVGGFDGYVENAVIFDRAINHDEIKALAEVDYAVEAPEVEAEDEVTINYVLYAGEGVLSSLCEKIKPSEKVAIYPGTDVYNFNAEESFIYDGNIYTLDSSSFLSNSMNAYGVYKKSAPVGTNLVPDGDFTDDNGNFSWGTWQTPRTDSGYNNAYFKDSCTDWFYKVNRDTNASVLYNKDMAAEDYALGTRWNDGVAGLCSMANFIPVEAGKTYLVSYDYKNKTAGVSAASIRTTFQSTNTVFAPEDGTDNNIPVNVTTDWQTNTFTITAPEDGYIYFHFYWLGSGGSTNTSSNSGSGPYWYFDNFEVFEVQPEKISARVTSTTSAYTNVYIENLTEEDVTVKVYAANYDDEGAVIEAASKTVEITTDVEYETVSFEFGGNVKIFFWDENMAPVTGSISAVAETKNVDNPDAHVMVVTKVAKTTVGENDTYKITGVTDGSTVSIKLNPDEYESTTVAAGNVIIYSIIEGLASDIQVLFASDTSAPADGVEDGLDGIISNELSEDAVTIHYGEITKVGQTYFCVGDDDFYYSDDCNVILVEYTGVSVSVESGSIANIKESTEKYKRTAFVKTTQDSSDEVRDVVVFIENVN